MKKFIENDLIKALSAIELMGITVTIIAAFYFQFAMDELPYPLCLLQRLGLLAIGFGFLLNIRFNICPSHYALSLLAAVFTSFVSLRQIALHVTIRFKNFRYAYVQLDICNLNDRYNLYCYSYVIP